MAETMASDMNIESDERLAYELLQAKDYPRAHQAFRALAQKGSAYAWNALGWMNYIGVIGEIDMGEAVSCYQKAAEGGFTGAFYSFGTLLVERGDEEGARQAFEAGANSGDLRSTYQFGMILIDKSSSNYDKEEGLKLLKQAAARGHFFSQRKILSIELEHDKSLVKRITVALKIASLAFRGLILHFRDRYSERL